jgi:hypothetical protein
MSKRKEKPAAEAVQDIVAPAAAVEVVEAFKGFDQNLQCRGFQYSIGQTFTHEGDVVRCAAGGFHSCDNPMDTWAYYGPATSRYCTVKASGTIARADDGDTKIASGVITISAELRLPEIIRAAVKWVLDRAKGNTATGDYGHAAATGDSGHAAATGRFGHAAATGDSGHAAATGDSGHAAATGDSGHAAATGDSGHAAATGDYGAAFAGFGGRAKAGAAGAFAIAWYDQKAERARLVVGTPGENGIKPDTWYSVNDAGELVEVQP